MTRGQGDTKACERRQKAVEREAAMEAKQAGTSATARVADDANPLTRRGYRSSMTKGRRSPILPFCGNSAYRVGDPPREPQDPSPPWACGWGAANPASPNGSPGQRDRYR
jgi:hypothetical protein